MKKILLLLLVLPIWAGCYKSLLPKTDEFTHTGCATDAGTRAGLSQSDVSLLILKYEDGNLRVTRTNATMNCSIKLNGIACDVSVDGNTIRYRVYEKDGPTANCMCRVAEMSVQLFLLHRHRHRILYLRLQERPPPDPGRRTLSVLSRNKNRSPGIHLSFLRDARIGGHGDSIEKFYICVVSS